MVHFNKFVGNIGKTIKNTSKDIGRASAGIAKDAGKVASGVVKDAGKVASGVVKETVKVVKSTVNNAVNLGGKLGGKLGGFFSKFKFLLILPLLCCICPMVIPFCGICSTSSLTLCTGILALIYIMVVGI
jgi:hypothetical protein